MFRLGIIAFIAASIAAVIPIPKPLDRQQERHSSAASQQSAPNERGTNEAPLVVKVLPASKTKEEAAQEQTERDDQSSANWWLVRLTGVLALIGVLQTIVFGRQAYRLKQTIDKLDEIATGQTGDMKASIAEATRAATAMEGVSESLKITVGNTVETLSALGKQMRAYITIGRGDFFYQDKAGHIFLQMNPIVTNTGLTPGRNVVCAFTAKVLPFPLPADYDLTLPEPDPATGCTMHPRNPYIYRAIAPEFYTEETLWRTFDLRLGMAWYVWGTVWYDDVSDGPRRHQNFGQICVWRGDGKADWVNMPRHNDGN